MSPTASTPRQSQTDLRASLADKVEGLPHHEPCCVGINGGFDWTAHRYAQMESGPDDRLHRFVGGQCYQCGQPWPCPVEGFRQAALAAIRGARP